MREYRRYDLDDEETRQQELQELYKLLTPLERRLITKKCKHGRIVRIPTRKQLLPYIMQFVAAAKLPVPKEWKISKQQVYYYRKFNRSPIHRIIKDLADLFPKKFLHIIEAFPGKTFQFCAKTSLDVRQQEIIRLHEENLMSPQQIFDNINVNQRFERKANRAQNYVTKQYVYKVLTAYKRRKR